MIGGIMAIIEGSTCWGQETGVTEGNVRTFSGNWTGTGFATGSGNNEKLLLASSAYMESEVVKTGSNKIIIAINKYASGDSRSFYCRTGASASACQAAEWGDVSSSGSFASLGYAQIRIGYYKKYAAP